MIKKRNRSLITLVCITLSTLLAVIPITVKNGAEPEPEFNSIISPLPTSSNYWDNFTFIHVKNNWTDFEGFSWLKGDGSWGDPYRIENMTINATTSPIGHGIMIEDSKIDYFISR